MAVLCRGVVGASYNLAITSFGGDVAKLRHLAVATHDLDATTRFYVDSFDLARVSSFDAPWGRGHVLTDGTISVSILEYFDTAAAGSERGTTFAGLHHIGFEVDDVDAYSRRVHRAGGRSRRDISDALGIPADAPIKEFEGPDGVVFDLGGPSVWKLEAGG
jgi:catechol 2,3-dioxygenase-like lactoylglutathione lyase family enzyme